MPDIKIHTGAEWPEIDVVTIGVNAAATLAECLGSVRACRYAGRLNLIYVDGGSSDRSLEIARSIEGVQVVALEPEYPSPGLGRNAGWRAGQAPLVQFLDSDTLLDPDWLARAVERMAQDQRLAAVCGSRREMFPERSVYNWIADLEWNGPPGPADAFGGDVLVRRTALEACSGYDEVLVGGEDPELSVRLRLDGWQIERIDAAMTRHDMAMTHLSQYWGRGFRTGYGFAAVTKRHGGPAAGFWQRELRRILMRGLGGGLLLLAGLVGLLFHSASLLLSAAGLCLILFPRLFRVAALQSAMGLGRGEARRYAWHCAAVVVPQAAGVLRYAFGSISGQPLRNRRRKLATRTDHARLVLLAPFLLVLFACSGVSHSPTPTEEISPELFQAKVERDPPQFALPATIEEFSTQVPDEYLLGPGDELSLSIWNRDDLSRPLILVGPDGVISVPRLGFINVKGRTRNNVAEEISKRLSNFYENPEVTLSILEYRNNKAFVLGQVAKPGVVTFPGQGTLLEALSLAGGLPVLKEQATLSKCAIIRGRDRIIWVDLKELLDNGNMALNARIRNNDVIYIPEVDDELVYVMGEVEVPGALRMRGQLSYLDALMMVGGPTRDANMSKTFIVRSVAGEGTVKQIDLQEMIKLGRMQENYLLQAGDVIYVAGTGISKWNYALRNILPFLQVLDLSTSTLESFGVMQELRNELWGQKGFVSGQ